MSKDKLLSALVSSKPVKKSENKTRTENVRKEVKELQH